WWRRVILGWQINVQSHFFHKGRCHDKEDQHNEHNVQHGGQIDIVCVIGTNAFFSTAHPDTPLVIYGLQRSLREHERPLWARRAYYRFPMPITNPLAGLYRVFSPLPSPNYSPLTTQSA